MLRSALLFALGAYAAKAPDLRGESRNYDYFDIPTEMSSGVHLQAEDGAHRIDFEFGALGRRFRIYAEINTEMFSDDYKETIVGEDGQILTTRRGVPKCYFAGHVVVDGLEEHGYTHFSTCLGGMNGVIYHPEAVFEVQYLRDEKRHVIMDFKDHQPRKK